MEGPRSRHLRRHQTQVTEEVTERTIILAHAPLELDAKVVPVLRVHLPLSHAWRNHWRRSIRQISIPTTTGSTTARIATTETSAGSAAIPSADIATADKTAVTFTQRVSAIEGVRTTAPAGCATTVYKTTIAVAARVGNIEAATTTSAAETATATDKTAVTSTAKCAAEKATDPEIQAERNGRIFVCFKEWPSQRAKIDSQQRQRAVPGQTQIDAGHQIVDLVQVEVETGNPCFRVKINLHVIADHSA